MLAAALNGLQGQSELLHGIGYRILNAAIIFKWSRYKKGGSKMQNSKEEKIINALLVYPTIREAGRALEIPESTIYNHLRNAKFKAKYNRVKSELLSQNTAYLQAKIAEAATTISEIMNNTENPPQVRLTACRTVLEYALKLTEAADIIPRLEAVEEALEESISQAN